MRCPLLTSTSCLPPSRWILVLCWSSTSPNTQNQPSVRSRECIQISQRERRGGTFCAESLCTSCPDHSPLNAVHPYQIRLHCALQTVQCQHELVRKVRVREEGRVSPDGLRAGKGLWCLLHRQIILAAIGATCTESYLRRNSPNLSRARHRRFVDHGERACNTTGQSECAQVHICSLLTSGGAIWSRSSDGPFWNFEGEHQKRRGREHSRQGIGIDKCHAALISLSVSSPACPAQSDTHVWCWSAGAYPIMDVDMGSVENQCAFGWERSQQCVFNGSWTRIFDGAIHPILLG